MTQMPDLKIKGRLVFRPDEGDTEHDLGEVEFGPVQPIVNAYAKRQAFATGGVIPSGTSINTRLREHETVIPSSVVRSVIGDLGSIPTRAAP